MLRKYCSRGSVYSHKTQRRRKYQRTTWHTTQRRNATAVRKDTTYNKFAFAAGAAAFSGLYYLFQNDNANCEEDEKMPKFKTAAEPFHEELSNAFARTAASELEEELGRIPTWQGSSPGGLIRTVFYHAWRILEFFFTVNHYAHQDSNYNLWRALGSTEDGVKWVDPQELPKQYLKEVDPKSGDKKPISVVFDLDLFVHVLTDGHGPDQPRYRKHTKYFVKEVAKHAEIIIWSSIRAANCSELIPILIDPEEHISHMLYREHASESWRKSLKHLRYLNRPMDSLVAFDTGINLFEAKENVVVIPDWRGREDDRGLLELLDFIEKLSKYKAEHNVDVRAVVYKCNTSDVDYSEVFHVKKGEEPYMEPKPYRKLIKIMG